MAYEKTGKGSLRYGTIPKQLQFIVSVCISAIKSVNKNYYNIVKGLEDNAVQLRIDPFVQSFLQIIGLSFGTTDRCNKNTGTIRAAGVGTIPWGISDHFDQIASFVPAKLIPVFNSDKGSNQQIKLIV